jgi:CubicO group peptidase (beta-lactamase class C family)
MVFRKKHSLKKFRPEFFCLLFALLILSCSGGSPEPYLSLKTAELAVEEALEKDRDAVFSIALFSEGEILWTLSKGMADPEKKIPVNSETLFAIGSVSKVFTAAAVMKLADAGRLDPDAPVGHYLPDFVMASPEYEEMTVAMLLDHGSGLSGSHYRGGFTDTPWAAYRPEAYESIRQSRLKHRPGYMHVYCNDGFTVAELVVEAVTGMAFTAYVEKELLAPLGMDKSRYTLRAFPEGSYAASVIGGTVLPMESVNLHGAGGLYSTVSDLSRFAAMIMARGLVNGKPFFSSEALQKMEQNRTKNTFRLVDTDYLAFGLGWDNVAHPGPGSLGIRALTKNGGTSSYRSEFWVLPEEKLGLAILSANAAQASLGAMAEKIILTGLVEKGRLSRLPEKKAASGIQPLTPEEGLMDAIAGPYANYSNVFRVKALSADSIDVEIRAGSEWKTYLGGLRYHEDGWFVSDPHGSPAIGFQEADSRRYMVIRSDAGYYSTEIPLAEQLKKEILPSEAWRKRTGRTWLAADEPGSFYFFYYGLSPAYRLEMLEELPGYVFAVGNGTWQPLMPDQAGHRADMSLLIPMALGRDLSDLEMVYRNGEEWFRYAGTLYRPLDSLESLQKGGQTSLRVTEEGMTRWIRLETEAKESFLSIDLADTGRWRLFDQIFEQQDMGDGPADIALDPGRGPYYLGFYAESGKIMGLSLR